MNGNEEILDDIVITLDIDWAPDMVIDAVSEMLVRNRVKATWFATHECKALRRLSEHGDLFEIGVHPNFMSGSTQGNTYREVLDHVKRIVPDAKSVRTHGMVYSAEISRLFAVEYGLENDTSIFIGEMTHITPQEVIYGDRRLLRMPYFWADDGEMSIKESPSFTMADGKFGVPGLKVLCLHPIHIFLNSGTMDNYNRLKKEVDIKMATEKDMKRYVNEGKGAASLLNEIIKANPNREGFKKLSEVGDLWRSRRKAGKA